MSHVVQLNAVHVESLERLEDDSLHVLPNFRKRVVDSRPLSPWQAPHGKLLARLADEQVGTVPPEPPVGGVAWVNLVMAAHPNSREELQSRFPT